MNPSTISETRNNFSALLDRVRAGESITILDRDRPIARIVPVRDADDAHLTDRRAAGGSGAGRARTCRRSSECPVPPCRESDVLGALLAEREDGR